MRPRPRRGWRFKASLAVGTAVALLVLVEGLLQVAFRVKNGQWLIEERRAFQVHFTTPVADPRGYTLTAGYEDDRVRINRHRFRGPEITPSEEAPIVAVLGDSVPFGVGVGNEETYPHVLEEELRRRGVDCRVLNAGVPSYNLRQALERLKREVLDAYRPWLVVLHAANDVMLLAHYQDAWTPDATWADVRWAKYWGSYLDCSATFRLLERRVSRAEDSERFGAYSTDAMVRHVRETLDAELAALAEASIRVLLLPVNPFYYQTANTGRNAQLAAFEEANYRGYFEATDAMVSDLNALLAEIAGAWDHCTYVDLRALMDAEDREGYFVDYIHLSPAGNRRVATELAERIVRDPELRPR